MNHTLITAKKSPDLDAIASGICYAYFLNQKYNTDTYIAAFAWSIQFEPILALDYLWIINELVLISNIQHQYQFKSFIILDYSERNGIADIVQAEQVIEVIDHKQYPSFSDFINADYRIEYVWSAATIIAERFYFHPEIELSPIYANLLLGAIFSNSLNFKARMSGFRDTRMAKRLIHKGANPNFPIYLAEQKTKYTKENMMQVLAEDSKLIMLPKGQLVDYLQLEVRNAEQFLDQISVINEHLQEIHREVECLNILHLHDIQAGITYFFSNYPDFLRYLEVHNFPGKRQEQYRVSYELLMRKDTIPLLKPILASIDNSTVLWKFLQNTSNL